MHRKAYNEYLCSLFDEETTKEKSRKKRELEIAESRKPSPEIPLSLEPAAFYGREEATIIEG